MVDIDGQDCESIIRDFQRCISLVQFQTRQQNIIYIFQTGR